jgi:phosphoribosylpyrophosphate synthetase
MGGIIGGATRNSKTYLIIICRYFEATNIEKQRMNRKLTDKQTALVDTIVATGCSITKASELAGYAKGESGRVTASKALKLPHVQEYMMRQIQETIGLNATKAVQQVAKLATGAKSEYVQLEASKDILDRAGYKPIDRAQVQVAGDIRVNIDLG